MPPTGSPQKEPPAHSGSLAHLLLPTSLTNSPTTSLGSGSMLEWTTSASSNNSFDITSPPHTFNPSLVALPSPPSTASDAASPSNRAAPPSHIAVQPASIPNNVSSAHSSSPSVQTTTFTINWDELDLPTDWISPSPSVSGDVEVSEPPSAPLSASLPRELVDNAFAALHRLSVGDFAHDSNPESELPAAHIRDDSANSRRELTSVGIPSRRPSPVPTVLIEDEDVPRGSQFNLFVEPDSIVEDDAPHSDYLYRQLPPTDSAIDEAAAALTRSPSPRSSYFSPQASMPQFIDAFSVMTLAHGATVLQRALSPSTRYSSPASPQIAPSSTSFLPNQPFSPTRSMPVGSILTESTSSMPQPQRSAASLASLLQSYSSMGDSTILEPDPSRGRQRYRREFPQSSVSPAIRPTDFQPYAHPESTAASSVSLVPEAAPAPMPMSSSSWVSPQPWTGAMSVTQPLAAAEPLAKYGRKAHPLPPTPPIPSQTGNMFTSQPLFWTEPIEPIGVAASSTSGSVASEHEHEHDHHHAHEAPGASTTQRTQQQQRQRPPLPPVPVDRFLASAGPSYISHTLPAVSAYPESSVKAGDRAATTGFMEGLPPMSMGPYMPASATMMPPWGHGWQGLAVNLGREQNDHSDPLYSTTTIRPRVWSPITYSYPPAVPPIAPQPVLAPPHFLPSPATYGNSDRMSLHNATGLHSPNVSATSPFIPSLNDFEGSDNMFPPWGAHPAPTGVRFLSPLPSPPSASPSTPRPSGMDSMAGPNWSGDRVRFMPPPPSSSHTATDEHGRPDAYNIYAPPFAHVTIPVIPPHLPPMPPAPSVSGDPQWTTNSRRYAFPDASVAFKVEQTLYKVHRSFFERHSAYFRRILAAYQYGSSSPVPLPDVKKIDFDRLLSIFYPSDLTKPDITTLKGWLAVLALSQKWEMDQIKRLCVRHIGHLAWPMEKVIIAHKYGLHNAGPAWLFAAYKEVCTRSVPLALRDAEQLSMEIVVNIWEVQHEVSTMRLRGESIEVTEKRVEELVKEKFGHFEVDTPPTTPAGRMPSFSDW